MKHDPESEPDEFIAIAQAIADGVPVEWDDVQQRAVGADAAATLASLRDLERIAAAQRQIGAEHDHAQEHNTEVADDDSGALPRWRHLLLLNRIGVGSFGSVYRAFDSHLSTDVALKLLARGAGDERSATESLREARLLAKVRHPNVVTVFGADVFENRIGVWMEYVQGRTLKDILELQGTFGHHEAAAIVRDVCRGVAAVHRAGVIHGDIKAGNVMRQEGGRIVLMDLGAGRALIKESHHSRVVPLRGTPLYLAPELFDGGHSTIASDVYALGVLLYFLVTANYPVSGLSTVEIAARHHEGRRLRLRDARPDLPDEFVRIVEQALAADPKQRFASAGALEEALARSTSMPAVQDRHPSRVTAARTWLMGLAAVAVLSGAGAAVYWRGQAEPPPAADPGEAALTVSPAVTIAASGYDVEAAFYRASRGGEEKLTAGQRVAPGDELFLRFRASIPLHLYVVNEDERGEAYLLYPLAGDQRANPVPAGEAVNLPRANRWRVTSPGGREHFVVFASPEPMRPLEQAFAALPSPKADAPTTSGQLSAGVLDGLRSIGGLSQAPATAGGTSLTRLFTQPLEDKSLNVQGPWIRQLTLNNPAR